MYIFVCIYINKALSSKLKKPAVDLAVDAVGTPVGGYCIGDFYYSYKRTHDYTVNGFYVTD